MTPAPKINDHSKNKSKKAPVELNNIERLKLMDVTTGLAPDQKQELLTLLGKYSHLFAENDLELGSVHGELFG